MPIDWKSFKDLEKQPNFPQLREEEWVPFVPTFRSDDLATDIYQDKNNLYVELPLVGIKPENVEISIENGILTIEGKSEEKKETQTKDYFKKEINRGSFQRTIKLPLEVKEDQASAESDKGILKITIPKLSKVNKKGKKVPIKIK